MLDHDQTSISRDYSLNLSGSAISRERAPLADYAEADKRMRAGEISLAIEIPPGFGRELLRGRPVQVGAWIDGAMPQRAETVRGYACRHPPALVGRASARGARRCGNGPAGHGGDALSLQSRCAQPAGHGAGGDSHCC